MMKLHRSWILAASLSPGCGPEQGDATSSASRGGGSSDSSTSSTSSTTSGETGIESSDGSSSTASVGESSSGTDSGGTSSCEDWEWPHEPYPWSLQDCLTDPCPEGEVCRYDPDEKCGARPVCVDPTTLACNCVLYPNHAYLACPCPGYDGPVNELGQALLECNTFMSASPVQSNEFGNCVN